ncbi:hypothetical protein GF371_04230 [Candidatus Woesearchaeota archaeon]|nr:hypothetical protein [Candidatus Woesearchaeota archaeon]
MAAAESLEEIKQQKSRSFAFRTVSFFVAIALLALGGIPILTKYGFLGIELELSFFVLNLLLVAAGIFLLLNSLRG